MIGISVAGIIFLFISGCVRLFSIPTGAMAPAIMPGDQIIMERFTFMKRKPRRGDILVFKTDGLEHLHGGAVFNKRIVGEPGDRLRLADGKLYVNDVPALLRNSAGEIRYTNYLRARYLATSEDTFTVPEGHYFVLGDNSKNSADSRMWGPVPNGDVLGKATFTYWPPRRMHVLK